MVDNINKESIDYFVGVVDEKFKIIGKRLDEQNGKVGRTEEVVNKLSAQLSRIDSRSEGRLNTCGVRFAALESLTGLILTHEGKISSFDTRWKILTGVLSIAVVPVILALLNVW
uniref:Uncharacterized protein n=1 Tax=viral metagenome TaxID=1070528 RepID=A0A6M3KBA8_9ZZZZ